MGIIESSLHVIYKISFPNEKFYLGQTKNFYTRMANHKKTAKNKETHTPLYNAIRKHGWDTLNIEILTTCLPEDVDDLERLYISKYKSTNRKFGYNLDTGGVLNKQHSAATRKKISSANRNKSSQVFKTRTKRICAYTTSGKFVGIYESASEAARIYGVASNTIGRAARGGRKTSCGLVWKWFEDSV